MKNQSQNKIILSFLKRGNGITPIEALELCGCFRLSARIYELREAGYDIQKSLVTRNGKHVAEYHLINHDK